MRYLKLLTVLFLGIYACEQKSGDNDAEGHIDVIDKTIQNVFDISDDTIIACKYGNGLILSKDAGQNWTELKTRVLFDEVTLADNGYLVGLDSWQGIHEPDYSRLYLSKDFGKTWETFNLDTKLFFPVRIISMPKQKTLVQTVDNKVYQLNGPNLKTDWTLIKSMEISEEDNKKAPLSFAVDDYDNHRIKLIHSRNSIIDTLAILDKCRQVNSIISLNKFVYISGAGYKTLTDKESYAYYACYSGKNGLKQYIIPGQYAYLKMTQLNRIYIMNDEGLFIANQDTLKKIY